MCRHEKQPPDNPPTMLNNIDITQTTEPKTVIIVNVTSSYLTAMRISTEI